MSTGPTVREATDHYAGAAQYGVVGQSTGNDQCPPRAFDWSLEDLRAQMAQGYQVRGKVPISATIIRFIASLGHRDFTTSLQQRSRRLAIATEVHTPAAIQSSASSGEAWSLSTSPSGQSVLSGASGSVRFRIAVDRHFSEFIKQHPDALTSAIGALPLLSEYFGEELSLSASVDDDRYDPFLLLTAHVPIDIEAALDKLDLFNECWLNAPNHDWLVSFSVA